jgi:hypothetical protein
MEKCAHDYKKITSYIGGPASGEKYQNKGDRVVDIPCYIGWVRNVATISRCEFEKCQKCGEERNIKVCYLGILTEKSDGNLGSN